MKPSKPLIVLCIATFGLLFILHIGGGDNPASPLIGGALCALCTLSVLANVKRRRTAPVDSPPKGTRDLLIWAFSQTLTDTLMEILAILYLAGFVARLDPWAFVRGALLIAATLAAVASAHAWRRTHAEAPPADDASLSGSPQDRTPSADSNL